MHVALPDSEIEIKFIKPLSDRYRCTSPTLTFDIPAEYLRKFDPAQLLATSLCEMNDQQYLCTFINGSTVALFEEFEEMEGLYHILHLKVSLII